MIATCRASRAESTGIPLEKILGRFGVASLDREKLIDHAEQRCERRLDCIAPGDGDGAVQDFLQHYRVSHQALALHDRLPEQPPRSGLVGWGRPR